MSNSLKQKIEEHNSGIGSTSTAPSHLCSYALFSYICSFSGHHDLLFYLERAWKKKCNRVRSNGVQDDRAWVNCVRK